MTRLEQALPGPLVWVLGALGVAGLIAGGAMAVKAVPALMSADGRRAWAFVAVVGGAIVFTLFAGVGVWLNRNHADHSFWLALAAHGQVLIGLTCLGGLLLKRMIRLGRDGIEISDGDRASSAKVETIVTTEVTAPAPPAPSGSEAD